MTLTAATLFAANGAVSKVILDTGISSLRLSELRATCGAAGLAVGLWVWLNERLDAAQLVGGLIVLAGIFLAETSR